MAIQPKRKPRPHFGLINKKKLFVEGFVLLRRLAEGPLSRTEAESEIGIPYREWYRWLIVFKECGIPLAEDYRPRRGTTNEKTICLWPEDWARLLDPRSTPRKRPTAVKPPSKTEIIRGITAAVKKYL